MFPLRILMQVILGISGSLGFALNFLLVYLIWCTRMERTWSSYRICLSVCSVHASLFALFNLITMHTHCLSGVHFAVSQNGPVQFIHDRWITDVIFAIESILTCLDWTLIPTMYMYQYLILCRSSIKDTHKFIVIYAFAAILTVPFMCTMESMVPEPLYRDTILDSLIRQQFEFKFEFDSDVRLLIYGSSFAPLPENNGRSMVMLMLAGQAVPFGFLYTACGVSYWRIHAALGQNKNHLSSTTLKMQRRFIKMLIIQGVLPIIFMGSPVAVFVVAGVAGLHLDRYSLLISACVAVCPIVHAAVYLAHLKGAIRKGAKGSSKTTATPFRATERSFRALRTSRTTSSEHSHPVLREDLI